MMHARLGSVNCRGPRAGPGQAGHSPRPIRTGGRGREQRRQPSAPEGASAKEQTSSEGHRQAGPEPCSSASIPPECGAEAAQAAAPAGPGRRTAGRPKVENTLTFTTAAVRLPGRPQSSPAPGLFTNSRAAILCAAGGAVTASSEGAGLRLLPRILGATAGSDGAGHRLLPRILSATAGSEGAEHRVSPRSLGATDCSEGAEHRLLPRSLGARSHQSNLRRP